MATILTPYRRFFALIALSAAACSAAAAAPAAAAADSTAPSPQPTIAVVTGDNVLVRSGAADSYYPFGRLHRGALVEVIGEKFNWARIATRGPAFAAGTRQGEFFGHIIYPQSETGRFRVSADGKTGVTLGRMDVLAPNLNTNFHPNDSWKPLIRLEPDTTVRILSTTTASNNTVHLIVLPADAEGWISKAHLRDATPEEIAAWRRAVSPASTRQEGERPKQDEPKARPATPPAAKIAPQPATEAAEEHGPAPAQPKEERPAPEARVDPGVNVEERAAQTVLAREEEAAPAARTEERAKPQAAAAKPAVEQVTKVTMEDLEVLLVKLRNSPAEISEVAHLRQMYLEFAARSPSNRQAARIAKARAEQLEIWRQVRERQAELVRIRERVELTAERTDMALLSIHAHADYDVIGRLTASTIFDGQRLPKMLRLQEPGTNRTLAYVEPEGHGFEMIEMIGLWIGVVGERSYDPALRLNVITPKRIDLLAPLQ